MGQISSITDIFEKAKRPNKEFANDLENGTSKIRKETHVVNYLIEIIKEYNKYLDSFQCGLEIVDYLCSDDVFNPSSRESRQSLSEFCKKSNTAKRSIQHSSSLSTCITNSINSQGVE